MKTIKIFILMALYCNAVKSQVLRIETSPSAIVSQIPGFSQITSVNSKVYSYTPTIPPVPPVPIDDDTTTEQYKIYNYADTIAVSISNAEGNITSTSVGKIWTLKISVPNAINIGLVFNQLNLSSTAEMYIFNLSKNRLDSAIKMNKFTNLTKLGIVPFRDSAIFIYIVEPGNTGAFQSSISIKKIEAGYQDIKEVGTGSGGGFRTFGVDCDPMIQCQPLRLLAARGVARVFCNGKAFTGTLLNNELNNGKAYFLTAFHCLDIGGGPMGLRDGIISTSEAATLSEARFQFSFWKTTCNGNINNYVIQFSGATLKAAHYETDFVLLELTQAPGIGDGVNYVGWNRQAGPSSDPNSYIIHHPETQDMRVTSTKKVKHWFWNNDFWTAKYSSGTVAKGSSGSALLNEYGQAIGQLRSGWSSCDYQDFGDRYGKFCNSWTAVGLNQWLSTNNLQSVNTLNLNPITISGSDLIDCTTANYTYTVPNLVGCSYSWSVPSNVNIVSGQNTPSLTIIRNVAIPGAAILITCYISDSKGYNRNVSVSRSVIVGMAPVQPGQINVLMADPAAGKLQLEIAEVPGATSYSWYKNGVLQTNSTGAFIQMPITKNLCNVTYNVAVKANNACGSSSQRTKSIYIPCQNLFVVNPNPASTDITVSSARRKNNNMKNKISQMVIYDLQGEVRKKQKFDLIESAKINISNLSPGTYFIEISCEKYKEKQQLIIQR